MARGNQREKAREKNLKEQAKEVRDISPASVCPIIAAVIAIHCLLVISRIMGILLYTFLISAGNYFLLAATHVD